MHGCIAQGLARVDGCFLQLVRQDHPVIMSTGATSGEIVMENLATCSILESRHTNGVAAKTFSQLKNDTYTENATDGLRTSAPPLGPCHRKITRLRLKGITRATPESSMQDVIIL